MSDHLNLDGAVPLFDNSKAGHIFCEECHWNIRGNCMVEPPKAMLVPQQGSLAGQTQLARITFYPEAMEGHTCSAAEERILVGGVDNPKAPDQPSFIGLFTDAIKPEGK